MFKVKKHTLQKSGSMALYLLNDRDKLKHQLKIYNNAFGKCYIKFSSVLPPSQWNLDLLVITSKDLVVCVPSVSDGVFRKISIFVLHRAFCFVFKTLAVTTASLDFASVSTASAVIWQLRPTWRSPLSKSDACTSYLI